MTITSSRFWPSHWPPREQVERETVRDLAWANRNIVAIAARYPNQWVAIRDEHIVAAHGHRDTCLHMARAKGAQLPIQVCHVACSRTIDLSLNPSDPLTSLATGTPDPSMHDAPITTTALRDLLNDTRFRSVSFDLHGTIVDSTRPWDDHIADAFRAVLLEHGFADVTDGLARECGNHATALIVHVAKEWYLKLARRMEIPALAPVFADPRINWTEANGRTLMDLVTWFGAPERIPRDADLPPEVVQFPEMAKRIFASIASQQRAATKQERSAARDYYPAIYARDPMRAVHAHRHAGEVIAMARAVHERISGGPPEAWDATQEQRNIVQFALTHGRMCVVLSNGSGDAVRRCVARHHPSIPPWQVFTPDAFQHAGKPSPANAAMLIAGVGCAMVRNALEGRTAPAPIIEAVRQHRLKLEVLQQRWHAGVAVVCRTLAERVPNTTPGETLSCIRHALARFIGILQLPASLLPTITILPHEHLHVGNSAYHDDLPLLGLGLPFPCVQYAPNLPWGHPLIAVVPPNSGALLAWDGRPAS